MKNDSMRLNTVLHIACRLHPLSQTEYFPQRENFLLRSACDGSSHTMPQALYVILSRKGIDYGVNMQNTVFKRKIFNFSGINEAEYVKQIVLN
jgi:hypothetical protein